MLKNCVCYSAANEVMTTIKVTKALTSIALLVVLAGITEANVVPTETSTNTVAYSEEPTRSPLVWSLAIQILCSILLCVVAHHLLHKTKKSVLSRVESLDRQLARMEMRLRMQEPNISLISQIAHKCNLQLDDENGKKTRLIQLVQLQASESLVGGVKAVNSNTNMLPLEEVDKTQKTLKRV